MHEPAQSIASHFRSDFRNYKTECKIQALSVDDDLVGIGWSDGTLSQFDADWLQDNCDCSKCLHPTSKEPLLHYTEKDFGGLNRVERSEDGLAIDWRDGHISFYSNGWLRAHSAEVIENGASQSLAVPWEASAFKMPSYRFAGLDDPKIFYNSLCDLEKSGVVLFTEVPRVDQQVLRFAEKIGAVRSTNFGTYFDVLAKIDPNSNAYTPLGLYSHTDLAHHDAPPAYQLLHFMENEAEGGLSTFVDGLAVAAALRTEEPEAFEQLTRPIFNFRFQDENSEHYYRGAIIEQDPQTLTFKVRLDLTVMAPIIARASEAKKARAAVKVLFEYVTHHRFLHERRLNGGDLVVFANTRLFHGRTAYEPKTGKRHLQGCYLDRCEVMSRMQVLKRQLASADGNVFDDSGKYVTQLHT